MYVKFFFNVTEQTLITSINMPPLKHHVAAACRARVFDVEKVTVFGCLFTLI